MSDQDDVFVLASPAPDLFVYPSQVHPDVTDDVTVTVTGDGQASLTRAVTAARALSAAGAGAPSVALDVTAARSLSVLGAGLPSLSLTVHPYVPPPDPSGGGGGNTYPTRLRPHEPDREDPVEEWDRDEDDALALLLLGAL